MVNKKTFIEVDYCQQSKTGKTVAGDVFISNRLEDDDRTICVLSDGLGSGIKANVLATLTATMAMKYVSSEIDIRQAAEIIMKTLPVCKVRKIGYSTFTILDIKNDGYVDIVEYDNPDYVLIKGQKHTEVEKDKFTVDFKNLGPRDLWHSRFKADQNDMVIIFTDGVTQSGVGLASMPLGWTSPEAVKHIECTYKDSKDISARKLAHNIISRALRNDDYKAKDDMTCAVIYFRKPRETLLVTGPPIDKANDIKLAKIVRDFKGKKIICGGTTANIVSRELGQELSLDLSTYSKNIPPISKINGIDLVTEGILTLTRSVDIIENCPDPECLTPDAAVQLVKILLNSDIINIVAGTKINDAHQDPNLPVELDIRKNLLKKFVSLLRNKYLKQANLKFI